ncbi:MAG: type IX secretion system sortase PorU [candidate division Zixibacteria bacterium]|nr:type IX secretion system sortase PorU [candidate division Zixibacteria bacterium]
MQILKSDQEGVIFRYRVPEFTQNKIELGGQIFDLINIDKCALSNLPGKPQLPIRRVIIAVPPQAEISVEILEKEGAELSGINLAYALKAEPDEKSPVGYKLIPSKIKETLDHYYPSEIVSVGFPTFLRNQRIIELEIFPVQYNSARKSVRYYSQITVKVHFSGGRSGTFKGEKDLFEKIYRNVLLNYDESKGWRKTAEERGLLKPGIPYPFGYSDNWYKVIVRENGIYKIDRPMLIQAGIPVSSLDPRTLRMFSGGGGVLPLDNSNPFLQLKEMAIFVSGEEDGTFDSEDFILFFGWSTNDWDYDSTGDVVGFHTNPFTNDNVFWLTFNSTLSESPKRMQIKDASLTKQSPIPLKFKSRIHVEKDKTLRRYPSGYVGDYFHWYWMETASAQMFVSLPGAFPQGACLIKVKHTGSYPNLWVNDEPAEILDSLSSASLTVARSFDFHGGLVDTLDISFPGGAFLDWYEIEYFRLFECHDRQLFFESPKTPGVTQFNISNLFSSQIYLFDLTDYFDIKRLEGVQIAGEFARFQDTVQADTKSRYFLVDESRIKKPTKMFQDEISSLKEVLNRADFLIITHSDFYDQIQSLKSFRESYNGMEVKVVEVQDVYDEFSGGLFDPVAIRDFLKFAYQSWGKPAPAFALLLGDGHYDYKNNQGLGSVNYIPPFAPTWEGDRSVSDENYIYFGKYGYLDSDSTYGPLDRKLDMVISRWPVRTEGEVEVVLEKVIGYEETPEFGTWRNLITLVADDEFTRESSSEAFHTQDTEELAKLHIPSSFNLLKIYLMEYPFDFKQEKPEAEEAIINAFNSGSLIINFMGHGNPDVWAHEKVFKRSQDIPRLNNKRKLPLVYTASCSIGLFFSPTSEGMAEEFLRAEDKGAIATISATWLVYPDPNAALNFEVYDLLLNQDSLSIGEALFCAKLLRQPNSNDRQFVLFGDPVMKLGAPRLKAELIEVSPDTLSALSLISVKGEVKDNVGGLMTDFNGIAKILAFDSQRKRTHTMPNEGKVSYDLPGLVMFKGNAEVKEGKFQVSFVVPKDISYGGNTGRISVYLEDQNSAGSIGQDGVGVWDSLVIRGSDTTVIDTIGPHITLSFDERKGFTDGETILPHSILKLSIFDEHGINITGEVGHGITLMIDQDFQHQMDLTGDFEYDIGSYRQGSLSYRLADLSEGDHVLTIKAWDNANNSSVISANVRVSGQRELELTGVMNYPNPFPNSFSDVTNFYYHLSQDVDRVEIKIFTQAGRMIRHIPFASSLGGINYSTTWNGRDQEGDEVANGVYIYKIIAEGTVNGERKVKEAFGKAVVVR